jgi:hypothetical protein
VLAPALPVLSLLFGNLTLIDPQAAVWPVLAVAGVALVLWLMLALVVADHRGAALAVTVLIVAALNHISIAFVAASLSSRAVVPMTYAGALALAAILLRAGTRTTSLVKHLNEILALALVLLGGAIAYAEWRRPAPAMPSIEAAEAAHARDLPDVYVLILDGYGRADVLREHYGVQNALVPTLRSLGFFVADEAASNYPQTSHSLASALNVDYLPTLLNMSDTSLSRRTLAELITHNRVFRSFDAAGYEFRTYSSEYHLVHPGRPAQRPAPIGYLTDFGYTVYETTAAPAISEWLGFTRGWAPLSLHRRHVRWTLDDLAGRAAERHEQPRFVFAHILAPHPPFAFNADGSDRHTRLPALFNDGDHWTALARGTDETYEEGYKEALAFLNTRVTALVRSILRDAARPTVIYIQGDHGPGSRLKWESLEESDIRERHGILLAMRFPDGAQPPLSQRTTPVNAFRVLVNRALGTNLRPVQDRSYFATWSKPFEFIDVTDRVQEERSGALVHAR